MKAYSEPLSTFLDGGLEKPDATAAPREYVAGAVRGSATC